MSERLVYCGLTDDEFNAAIECANRRAMYVAVQLVDALSRFDGTPSKPDEILREIERLSDEFTDKKLRLLDLCKRRDRD